MNSEFFFVLFENLGNYLSLSITEEEIPPDEKEDNTDEKDNTDDKEDTSNKKEIEIKGEEGLESWKIALIVVFSILALIIILVIIYYFLRKNKRLTNRTIEDKMENLTDIK